MFDASKICIYLTGHEANRRGRRARPDKIQPFGGDDREGIFEGGRRHEVEIRRNYIK